MHFPSDSEFGPPISERPIFAVDDNEAERALFLEALRETGVKNPCRFFPNGDKMIDSINTGAWTGTLTYTGAASAPLDAATFTGKRH